MINRNIYRRILLIIVLLSGLSAIIGGYGLIFTDWFKIPLTSIQPFNSFMIPGLILGFVVGGTHILAAIWLSSENKFALEATAVAGFGLLIWMFTEVYIMSNDTHWVQTIYFSVGLIILILTLLLLKNKHPFPKE